MMKKNCGEKMLSVAFLLSLTFTIFDKDMGRFVIQRWKPKSALNNCRRSSVNEWVRARLALERDPNTFVIFGMNDDYDARAFVFSNHKGLHVMHACVWHFSDTETEKRRIFSELRTWHEATFPDVVVTIGDVSTEERHAWSSQ